MLKFAAEKKLQPIVETLPIGEKGCAEAVQRVSDNKVKYRFSKCCSHISVSIANAPQLWSISTRHSTRDLWM